MLSLRHPAVFVVLAGLAAGLCAAREPAPAAGEGGDRRQSSRLQGTVAGPGRTFVIGATVVARRAGDASAVYLTATGDRGRFRLDSLPDGDYSLEFAREGFRPLTKGGVTLRFPFRPVVEVAMEEGSWGAEPPTPRRPSPRKVRVSGSVVEQGGAPLGEVRLRFVRVDGAVDPRSARSRPDGGFELDEVGAGAWRVSIEGVGYLVLRTVLDLEADTELAITLVTQPPQYDPSPLDLMPPEQPIPPDGWDHEGDEVARAVE